MKFSQKTHNVLNYMLPVASKYSKKVNLGAITLTNKNSSESLWKYDKKLVSENAKSFAFELSFSKIELNKYYRSHKKHLNRILKSNENIELL